MVASNWLFEGRFAFAPCLVRAPEAAWSVSVFGWTLGGFVALEYDSSPVGRYYEFVEMGSIVAKNGALGQWGRELMVSTSEAEEACQEIWGVPAREKKIQFDPDEGSLSVDRSEVIIKVGGWGATRGTPGPRRSIPLLWTPEVKALWAPLRIVPTQRTTPTLNLHDIHVSATSLKLLAFSLLDEDADVVPLGFAIAADGLQIDISPHERGRLL